MTVLDRTEVVWYLRRAYRISWRWLRRHRWLALAFILAGIGVHVFAELSDELLEGTLLPIDRWVLHAIRPFRSDLLAHIAFALSELLRWPWAPLLAVPFFAYLVAIQRHRTLVALVVAPLSTLLIIGLTKLIFQRDRPVTALVAEFGHSFPSGHAMGATVFYGLLGYIAWRFMTTRRWARAVIFAVTVLLIAGTGLARIYLHVHYPSDVLAGWAAGLFILAGTLIAVRTWPRSRRRRDARASEA